MGAMPGFWSPGAGGAANAGDDTMASASKTESTTATLFRDADFMMNLHESTKMMSKTNRYCFDTLDTSAFYYIQRS